MCREVKIYIYNLNKYIYIAISYIGVFALVE